MQPAVMLRMPAPTPDKSIFLNVYTESEIYVEKVETEVRSRTCARAFIDAVGRLMFLSILQSEYSERQIETDIFHDEYAYSGAEVQ